MALTSPRLRTARLDDYAQIRKLGLSFSLGVPPEEDWRKLWLDNPLRSRFADPLPLGWMLETPSGEMLGTMGTVLAPYWYMGRELVSAVSRAWFVKMEYRAFALQLMDEYLNQPKVDLFINNAVSMPALESFKQFCAPLPVGQWDCISFWDAFDKPPPASRGGFTVEMTDRFDSRFDAFWRRLLALNPEKLLAERTSRTLTWHFGSPMRRGRLWVITASKNGTLCAYCTLTRQDRAFELPALPVAGSGAASMRLVDFQSIELEQDLLPTLLSVAVERCAKEGIILEHLGRGVPKMRVLDEGAPHVKKLENWKFFYRAADEGLHAELSSPRRWDPSAYDGDASFE